LETILVEFGMGAQFLVQNRKLAQKEKTVKNKANKRPFISK
jgi:hypothetical protein